MKRIFWKRGIAGIAAMVMLLSLAAVGSMEEQVVYQEDFEKLTTESLASDGWAGTFYQRGNLELRSTDGNGTIEVVKDEDAAYGNVLKVCDNDPSQYYLASKIINKVENAVTIELDIKTTAYGTVILASDHANGFLKNTNNMICQIAFLSGKIEYRLADGTVKSSKSYKVNEWHHVKFVSRVDSVNNEKTDIYVDNELLVANVPCRWPKDSKTYFNMLLFGCYQGDNSMKTTTYIDNIKVSTGGDTAAPQKATQSPTAAPAITAIPSPTAAPAATAAPLDTADGRFTDITGHWARAVIEELAAKKVINGVTATSFAPDEQITRAEFAALVTRATGIAGKPYANAYGDVQADAWFASTVQAAKDAGLLDSAMTAEGFNPDANITREEMTSLIVNACKAANVATPDGDVSNFADAASISPWAVNYVGKAVSLGIVKGRTTDEFAPRATATRAEAATMIKRMIIRTGYDRVITDQSAAGGGTAAGGSYNEEKSKDEILDNIKMLYSSDTTNILSCIGPWHPTSSAKLSKDLILAPIDEAAAAGIDVYNIQPGMGWVPWWPSKVYPAEEHVKWFQENVRANATNTWLNYLEEGNDIVKESLDRSHELNTGMVVSFRLNDVHQKENAFNPDKSRIESVPKSFLEHPEYLIGVDPNQESFAKNVQDWQYPEVRQFKLDLIKELIQNYDLDGFELDFMRAVTLFNTTTTTEKQRDDIMVDFVKQVRAELDKKEGRYRYLAVRIPAHIHCHDAMGIDVKRFAEEAGVDIFDLSTYYHTEQHTSLKEIKELVGNKKVFAELTHASSFEKVDGMTKTRRTTPEQLNTAAYLAYKNGADGIALFNFQYYREQVNIDDGPYGEPPFELIEGFKNKDYLAKQPQHYYFTETYRSPKKPYWEMPTTMEAKKTVTWEMDMAAPEGGWTTDGRLRIQGKTSLGTNVYTASINGVTLKATDDVSEPYENQYTQMLGTPEELRAWIVPKNILKEGINQIQITQNSGEQVVLDYLDLAIE